MMEKNGKGRVSELRAAEKELEEVDQIQHSAVFSWSCGNNDGTSNDQRHIYRLAELITKM